VPTAVLEAWIDESYRAVAPKKLVAALEAQCEPFHCGCGPAGTPTCVDGVCVLAAPIP
jgi:hypothetical protein